MPAVYAGLFTHRANEDGTFDSFCRHCFAIIAAKRDEADLKVCESQHLCNPWLLQRYAKVRELLDDVS